MIVLFFICCLAGDGLGLEVRQSASELITNPGDTVHIFCSHDKTDYRVMLWYQRSPGDTAMKLIGYLYFKDVTMEKPYDKNFNISGDMSGTTAKNGSLIINLAETEHSAVYYCAARGDAEAYFGAGTKLTVLDSGRNITAPKVTLLPPSPKQCQNQTLICVATGFYPDHVTVSWEIDGQKITSGVATDALALLDGNNYSITSRLRVSAKTWYTPGKKFTCIVSFFNGNKTIDFLESVEGVKGKTEVRKRSKYLKITQTAKLSYGVFIAKGCIYGAFVTFLVWKLQRSAIKENN